MCFSSMVIEKQFDPNIVPSTMRKTLVVCTIGLRMRQMFSEFHLHDRNWVIIMADNLVYPVEKKAA